MAKRKSESPFDCEVCEMGFDYQSKYARHLESGSHKMFAESLNLGLSVEHHHDQPEELSLTRRPPCLLDSNITEVS